jgi:hypothetical protein
VKNLKLFSILSCAVVVMGLMTATSCKKGDTGATGAAGATGATGAAGASGTDSIQYSAWTPLAMTYQFFAVGDTEYVQTITAASDTQNILDQGVVLTYLSYTDPTAGTIVESASDFLIVELSVGAISLDGLSNDFSGTNFRYVVIPGGIQTSSTGTQTINGYTVKQLKAMSYANVSKLFAIPGTGAKLKAGSN